MAKSKRLVDPAINRMLEQFGYAQVIVILKNQPVTHSAAALGFGAAIQNSTRIASYFLNEIPTSNWENASAIRKAVEGGSGSKAAAASLPEYEANTTMQYFPLLGIFWGYIDSIGKEKLIKDKDVQAFYYSDSISMVTPLKIESARKNRGSPLWNMEHLDIRYLADKGLTGKGVRVGHLDTGVDGKHEVFSNTQITFVEIGLEGDRLKSSSSTAYDSGRHGTHTAATICGGEVDGVQIGIAPGAHLCSAMVIEGGKTAVRVLAGMEWAIEQNVRILNMSLGLPYYNPFFEVAITRLRQHGVLPVVAIGNEGVHTSRSPGNYAAALSVGAMTKTEEVASFSSSQTFDRGSEPFEPNVIAPGVGIVSARAGGGIISMDGTSMAAPQVSGLIALLMEAYPEADIIKIESAVQLSAKQISGVPIMRQGNGLISPRGSFEALSFLDE